MKFMGIKQGMMRVFDHKKKLLVCTVIMIENHLVSQLKTSEKDGYDAVQVASFKLLKPSKIKNQPKPQRGHFKKAGIECRRRSCEFLVDSVSSYQVGQELCFDKLESISFVDVRGVSKGKGYQGVIKRHNFSGGPASHGSGFHRHGGSCGMRSKPGRCLPGQKKAGRMGGGRVTVENLRVVRVDVKRQLVLVEGAVPGPRGGVVYITPAIKKSHNVKRTEE